MSKKDRIARLLAKMDGPMLDQLEEALGGEEEVVTEEKPTKHEIKKRPNRRRGRGKKRREETLHLEDHEEDQPRRGNSRRSGGKRRKSQRKTGRGNNGKACRTLPFDTDSPRDNKFAEFIEDVSLDGDEERELKAAAQADRKAKKNKRFKGSRPNPMVWVRCRGCGDEEEVSASLVHDPKRYKCNDCAGTACG